jgi:uncharacterized protein
MPFYCLRCGECCSAMGDVHELEGNPAIARCVVVNRYTGERTCVEVDPDKVGLLAVSSIPGACPVYETWPAICAEYACWRLLVLGPVGHRAARVMGYRHLAVDDPALEAVLAPHRAALARAVDDAAWDAALVEVLESAGYRVVR